MNKGETEPQDSRGRVGFWDGTYQGGWNRASGARGRGRKETDRRMSR